MPDVQIEREGTVAFVELRRPPHNFFDGTLISEIAGAFEDLDADSWCRAIVLAAEGRSFCVGADFSGQAPPAQPFAGGGRPADAGSLYHEALRLFAIATPVVGARSGRRRRPRVSRWWPTSASPAQKPDGRPTSPVSASTPAWH